MLNGMELERGLDSYYSRFLLGGRLTVRLRTLDPPIGVRIPASQPFIMRKLRPIAGLAVPFSALLCAILAEEHGFKLRGGFVCTLGEEVGIDDKGANDARVT